MKGRRFLGDGTEARDAPNPAAGSGSRFPVPMAADPSDPAKSKPAPAAARRPREGYPSNAELLHELRLHGAKPPPPREIPAVSRRTRDYLLIAGAGSAAIGFGVFQVLGAGEPGNAVKLALTGIAVFCGLLWFIFYGVMSRY